VIPRKSIVAPTSKVLQKSPITVHHVHPHAYEGEEELVTTRDSYLALRLRLRDRDEDEDEEEEEEEEEPEPTFSEFSEFSEEAATFLITEVLKLISSGTEEIDRSGMGKVMRFVPRIRFPLGFHLLYFLEFEVLEEIRMLISNYTRFDPVCYRPSFLVIVTVIVTDLIRYQLSTIISPIAYHLPPIAYRLSPTLHRIPKRYEVTLGRKCSRFPSSPVAHDDQMLDLPFLEGENDDGDGGQGNDGRRHDEGHHANEGKDEHENDGGNGHEVREDQSRGNDGRGPDINPGFDDDQDQYLPRGSDSHGESARERSVDIDSISI
jgi:hypothetical protein